MEETIMKYYGLRKIVDNLIIEIDKLKDVENNERCKYAQFILMWNVRAEHIILFGGLGRFTRLIDGYAANNNGGGGKNNVHYEECKTFHRDSISNQVFFTSIGGITPWDVLRQCLIINSGSTGVHSGDWLSQGNCDLLRARFNLYNIDSKSTSDLSKHFYISDCGLRLRTRDLWFLCLQRTFQ